MPAPTLCEAIGEFRGCVPDSAEPFPSENFVVTDLEDQLFLIDGLAHVNLRPKAHDIPQLLEAMEALLAVRTQ